MMLLVSEDGLDGSTRCFMSACGGTNDTCEAHGVQRRHGTTLCKPLCSGVR